MSRVEFGVIITLFGCCLSGCCGYFSLEVGDPCPTREYRSSCQPAELCTMLPQFIQSGRLSSDSVVSCGYTTTGEKICCPLETGGSTLRFSPNDNKTKTATEATTTTTTEATTTEATTTTTTTTTEATTTTTTATTTTEAAPWLSIFQTDREYVQRSVAFTAPFSRDSIVFPDMGKRAGAACRTPLYEGKCSAISQCQSVETLLQQRRLRDDDVQTCAKGTVEEIICCPTNLPLQARGQVATELRLNTAEPATTTTAQPTDAADEEAAIAKADELLPQYKHLAALAYPNAAFDGHVHRCTALALTPRLLLTAAGCGRASHAVFGVADMRDVDVDEDYLVDIAHVAVYHEDLALLRLAHPLPPDEPKVSLAPMCTQFELTRLQVSGQLLATAWAKGNASDCPLYELPMRLLPSAACNDIARSSAVQGLPSTHLCVAPIQLGALSARNASSCAPCPAVVGSVLHLRRPSGSRCVLAIATPTGANCEAPIMYFTSLLDAQLVQFVEQQQQQH